MFTQDQLIFLAYIQNRNAETQAWIDAGPDRWAGFLPESLEYWAEMGITSVAEYERDNLISFIRDASKDAYGFRMHRDWDSMSMAELEDLADSVSKAAAEVAKREEEEQAKSVEKFEANVIDMIDMGAGDRTTAIRWMFDTMSGYDGYDSEFRAEAFCYEWNLPFSMAKELAKCLEVA